MKKIIIYDFDGTLTPYPITDFKILEKCGYVGGGNNEDFQKLVKKFMEKNDRNIYESFYNVLLDVVRSHNYNLNDDILSYGANQIEYNVGVKDFLEYFKNNNVLNYVISKLFVFK